MALSSNHLVQLCLEKAQSLFSLLPSNVQDYLSHPLARKAVASLVALQLLRGANRYLSEQAQNNWVRARPWNASRELVLLTGGSSGIGKQIMLDLSKLNVRTIIVDVREPDFRLRESTKPYVIRSGVLFG
jgi:phosphoglycerate dehydrogenase-like enzyme